jgi:hypothetical protein
LFGSGRRKGGGEVPESHSTAQAFTGSAHIRDKPEALKLAAFLSGFLLDLENRLTTFSLLLRKPEQLNRIT